MTPTDFLAVVLVTTNGELWKMLGVHALCDYPLQGDFLARGKNHTAPIPGVPWKRALGDLK